MGLYDRAAIVFTADHGEGLGQHRWMFHARIYNEQMHVPLIVRLPGRDGLRGKHFTEIVSLIDVLPTLAGSLGIELTAAEREQFEGIDVLGRRGREYVFASRLLAQPADPDRRESYALAGPRWKYFLHSAGGDELFDLSNDPDERRNVIRRQPQVAGKLKALLQGQLDAYAQAAPRLRKKEAEMSETEKEQLRQLGY